MEPRTALKSLLVAATLSIAACSSPQPGMEVLVDEPHGLSSPDALEVRVYNRYHEVTSGRIAMPALPGAVRLTSVASAGDQLRIVVLGLDAQQQVQTLAGAMVTAPATTSTLSLHLTTTFADGDHDGVPDALDDCPTVADALQNDARGFGSPGDACLTPPDMSSAPDLAPRPGPDMASGPDMAQGNCPVNAILCDDFEGNQIDVTKWMVTHTTGSVVEIDPNHANSGMASLHVHLPALTPSDMGSTLGYATVKEQAGFPTTNIHVRAYVLVPGSFGNDPGAFMLVEQPVTPYAGIGLQLEAGGFSMFNGLRNTSVPVAGTARRDAWICIEYAVIVDSAGSATMWVDGRAELSPVIAGDTTSTPPVGELVLGLVDYTTTAVPARDLWFDDVVISKSYIGCQ
jgi:hypothetical protein